MAISSKDINMKAAADILKQQNKNETATPGNTANAQNMLNTIVGNNGGAGSGSANSGGNAAIGNSSGIMTQNQNTQTAQVPTTQSVPTMDGMRGVRSTLNNYGIYDVGWNDATKSVTINGKDYYTPSKIVDGTSYASDKDIYNIISNVYKDKGTSIAGATDYVNSQGISNAVKWSGGQLMVGGQNVPVAYVDDNGTAYADKNELDKAIAAYKQNAGITGNQGVYDNWDSKYGSRIEDALSTILNREKWSYDAESDPAYQAYKDAYTREGNRAYQNAYAQMAANTGGYGSSAGMTAAGQQMNYYMQQLNDRVPELMQNSYNRYLGEQELNRAALESLMGVANDDYSKAYQANRDSINDSNAANYQNYLRDIDARDYNRRVETEDRLWDYNKQLLQNQVQQSNADTSRYEKNADLDIQAKQISNQMAQLQAILSKYQYGGNADIPISAEDAAAIGLSRKADGTYPTIREIQKAYSDLQYTGFENYDLRMLAAELAMQQQYK